MTEAELMALARDRDVAGGGLWSSQVYGIGKWLKRYAGFPDDLPLCAETDHGPGNATIPHKTYLETRAPAMLYHNAEAAKAFRLFSRKPCEVMGSPFAYFRWMNGLGIRPDAAGTVALPSHSTHHVQVRLDWRRYCRELRRIPERFRPVKVCLYWKDILDGLHKVFQEEGFEVITAGHIYDEGFVERFYGILAGHRYATSNDLCTAGIYAVEMGLPFFLWGEQEHDFFNTGGESCFPKDGFRPADVVGYYALDSEGIGRLRAGGIPEGVAAGLESMAGKRFQDPSEFLSMLERHAGPHAGSFREAILKQSAVPRNPPRDRRPFLEPVMKVSAAQAAYAERYLGTHSALRPSQLRELLWACLDEAVLGKAGAVARVFPGLRRHAYDPGSGRRACPACGSFEAKAESLADIPDSPAAGVFRLCLDCGTCSRSPMLPRPDPAVGGLRREEAGGVLRLTGLESCLSPLDDLKDMLRGEAGDKTLHILAPALGGEGPEAYLRDTGLRTLFTVTGMRLLLRRAGFSALSACQDSRGRINALGRLAGGGYPSIHASPEPAERALAALIGSGSEASAEGEGCSSASRPGQPDGPERLAALLSDLHLRPGSPGIYKALAELFFRVGNPIASELWLGLYTERSGPDASAYALMDRLRVQLGFGSIAWDPAGPPVEGPGWSAAPAEDPGDSLGLIVRVIEALSQDRNDEALELIDSGMGAGSVDPELRYARAIALERLERLPDAIGALESLLAERPHHGEARSMLRRLAPERRGR